jgi:GTP-binding protein
VADLASAPPGFVELGRKLFARDCAFLWSATSVAQVPPPVAPEIAFAGRSNVGKSSLLNALTARKALARTSRTPGRTRELHCFALGSSADAAQLCLIDMPGYGHAAAPKEKIASWTELIEEFLRGRTSLLRVFLLIDGRHGARPNDIEMMRLLNRSAVSYQLVLTKKDELKAAEQEGRLASTSALAGKHPAAFPEVIFTSSHSGEGISEMRAAIAKLLSECGR